MVSANTHEAILRMARQKITGRGKKKHKLVFAGTLLPQGELGRLLQNGDEIWYLSDDELRQTSGKHAHARGKRRSALTHCMQLRAPAELFIRCGKTKKETRAKRYTAQHAQQPPPSPPRVPIYRRMAQHEILGCGPPSARWGGGRHAAAILAVASASGTRWQYRPIFTFQPGHVHDQSQSQRRGGSKRAKALCRRGLAHIARV